MVRLASLFGLVVSSLIELLSMSKPAAAIAPHLLVNASRAQAQS